jgi:hypothetical protein
MDLNVKALGSSEMWVKIYQSTQCNVREDMNLQPLVILIFLLFLHLQTRKVPCLFSRNLYEDKLANILLHLFH